MAKASLKDLEAKCDELKNELDNLHQLFGLDKLCIVGDTETTGLITDKTNPDIARILEYSFIKFKTHIDADKNGKPDVKFEIIDKIDIYLNPEAPLSPEIIKFNEENKTGITNDGKYDIIEFKDGTIVKLKDLPTQAEGAQHLKDFLQDAEYLTVGHNMEKYDKPLLDFMMSGIGESFAPEHVFDTLITARAIHAELEEAVGSELKRIYDNGKIGPDNRLGPIMEKTPKTYFKSADAAILHTSAADILATLDVLKLELEQVPQTQKYADALTKYREVDSQIKKLKKSKELIQD